MDLEKELLRYARTPTNKSFAEFMHFPDFIPLHSISNWEDANEIWQYFGEGANQWPWLIAHSDLLTHEMLENVKTELWVEKYYSCSQKIEEEWTAIYRSKSYNGQEIPDFEQLCKENIDDYLHIRNFKDDQMDYSTVPCTGAYRLLLLYERAGKYQDEKNLAEELLKLHVFGQKFWKRLEKGSKELNIEISDDDKKLIEMDKAVEQKNKIQEEKLNEELEKKTIPDPSLRMSIPSNEIDEDQLTPANPEFTKKIIKKYYSSYPVKPFISKDQEYSSAIGTIPPALVPKENMTRFSDGLLPGDVRLLYWIKNVHRKRIPGYFVYQYGICVPEEKEILMKNGYIDQNGKVTEKGEKAISDHPEVWMEQ